MTRVAARPTGLLLAVLLIQSCSSTPPREATGTRAEGNLQQGVCPASIVDRRGRDGAGNIRYDRNLNPAQLNTLRRRELENCSRAVASGDTAALHTLVGYYRADGQTADLVRTLERYVAAGKDRDALKNSSTYLYHTYAAGAPGVAADQAKAFRYLGIAVNSGAHELELSFARELMQRDLFEDAIRSYREMLAHDSPSHQEQRCEANLSLGQLYFGASARHENWNLGYYYWGEGLALADGAEWGSCAEDNFVYGDRYDYESRRKRFVDSRIALMSAAQRQVIDEARRDPRKGYAFIADLSFSRPASAPPAPTRSAVGTAGSSGLLATLWPRWMPLNATVCGMRGSSFPLAWSSVFETNADSIWSVDSRNGTSQSQGSAVAVSTRQLVTNCHLVENPQRITLRRVGWSLPARLQAADRQGDRCILEVDQDLPDFVRAGRSQDALKVGEDVAAIGNPQGLETSLSRGIVAQKRARDGLRLIQTDAAISPGSSGGGLFDHAGNLVGITTFTISSGQSLNFAIAVDEFCH